MVYVLEGINLNVGLVVNIQGSIYHKHIEDWYYYILMSDNKVIKVEELEELKEYTIGQWSDGIGEGFEQSPVMCLEKNYNPFTKEINDKCSAGVKNILSTLGAK